VQKGVMIVTILFVSGCGRTSVNNFCLWALPITVTEEELNEKLSIETLRQIDDYNQEWSLRCKS
jgi:hypothetical protein